jgi:hypothetical protein
VSGELHELSAVIGRLQEATEAAQRDRLEILAKLDALQAAISIVPQMRVDLDAMKPEIEHMKRGRWVGLGILGTLSLTGGGIGSQLWKVLFGSQ